MAQLYFNKPEKKITKQKTKIIRNHIKLLRYYSIGISILSLLSIGFNLYFLCFNNYK